MGSGDDAILALLVGCGLQREELVSLDVEEVEIPAASCNFKLSFQEIRPVPPARIRDQ
ncbi:MAG TPA: hypothetical protein VE957_22050 [Terriglobales bacterium]|nr:hypothetical protein [Terriglobales bacterium]